MSARANIDTADAETGRDTWDASLEDDIDKCKTIDNLKPTDTIITVTNNTNQNDNHTPATANEWTETIEKISEALASAEDIPEGKRESFT